MLYRGIKNVKLGDSILGQHGGTEYGPMSTSRDIRVALAYTRPDAGAACENVLLLRLKAASFMDQGVSLGYLSCFPQEQEYLCAPL